MVFPKKGFPFFPSVTEQLSVRLAQVVSLRLCSEGYWPVTIRNAGTARWMKARPLSNETRRESPQAVKSTSGTPGSQQLLFGLLDISSRGEAAWCWVLFFFQLEPSSYRAGLGAKMFQESFGGLFNCLSQPDRHLPCWKGGTSFRSNWLERRTWMAMVRFKHKPVKILPGFAGTSSGFKDCSGHFAVFWSETGHLP